MFFSTLKNKNLRKIICKIALFLFLFLFFSFSAKKQSNGQLFAVVVGVSEYEDWKNDLTYSHQDAIEMYDLLTYQTEQSNIKLLLNEDATCDNILKATRELFTRTAPNDIVIFFFSGHGENGYFRAHDKKLTFKSLREIFKQTSAKRKIIFADACFSGTLRPTGEKAQDESSNNDIGPSVLLFLSSRSNQISNESLEMKSGAFTYYLVDGLCGGADTNKDRYITARELFDFVNPKVKEYTGGKQVPVMWGKFDDNMVIFNWNKK